MAPATKRLTAAASTWSPPPGRRRWRIDLNDEVVGAWRGEYSNVAAMTLVWGVPLVPGAAIATAELANLAVDQSVLQEGRFTLLEPDDYRGDVLDVKVLNDGGEE